MPATDRIRQQLMLLPSKKLMNYARKMRLQKYSKMRKDELLELIAFEWKEEIDEDLQEDIKEQEQLKMNAQVERTARTRITEQIKKWVSETKYQEVRIAFPVNTGKYADDLETSTPIFESVYGKIKVLETSKDEVVGSVVSVEQEHPNLPKVNEILAFKYIKAIPKSTVKGTKPTYYTEDFGGHLITPYDDDPVYSGNVYYGESQFFSTNH